MAKNKFAQAWDVIDKLQKKQAAALVQVQADCPHHTKESSTPSLIRVNKPQGAAALGNKDMFKCKHCRKFINLYTITEEDLDKIVEQVDAICDVIKMSCDLNREEDLKILKHYATIQKRVRLDMKNKYLAACKYGTGKKKQRGSYRNSGDTTWKRPISR